jgi:hypothetical protein
LIEGAEIMQRRSGQAIRGLLQAAFLVLPLAGASGQGNVTIVIDRPVRARSFAGVVVEGGGPLPDVTVDILRCRAAREVRFEDQVLSSTKTDQLGHFSFRNDFRGNNYCLRLTDHVHWSNTTILKINRMKSAKDLVISMTPMT